MSKTIKILFIGDIVGQPGYRMTKLVLPGIIEKENVDFVIANGENISDGMGILKRDSDELLGLPIDLLTGGNHTLDKIQSHKFINESKNILRPLNYPKGVYGSGYGIYTTKSNAKIAVINLIGRVYMKPLECPFRAFDRVYEKIKSETNIIFVDFHAEATSEKIAFGWYADGKVSAVVGTHTHVQTADSRILPNGTAYITDVGMTGPYDSVIGMKKETSIKRYLFGTPFKHEVAEDDVKFAGVIVEIDSETGKSKKIERILKPEF
ncbi:MAG TPA: TIGR00282 family metallophosphoesterase [Ignavibacteria bacterium]|nr:TIGR00282 family metallophosphoesterase [Ignavibacteria bacterium]